MRSRQQINILQLLQDSRKDWTTKELQTHFNFSYQMITRHLRNLTEKKAVSRRSTDRGFSYRFRQWPKDEREFSPQSPRAVRAMIRNFTAPEWQPMISKRENWGKIGQVLLDINTFNVASSHGEKISQSQLDRSKAELRSVFEIADQFRLALGSLLATDNIWDVHTLNAYLSEE